MAGDSVPLRPGATFVGQDSRFGNGVHQPKTKQRRRRAARLSGGVRGDLLFLNSFGLQQRGRLLLNHNAALLEQRITRVRRDEPRGMHFYFIAHPTDHGGFMTLRAGVRVKQWTETLFRGENPLEHFPALGKLSLLLRRQTRQRLSQTGLFR